MTTRQIVFASIVILSCGGCQLGNLTATNIQKPLLSDAANERSATFIDAGQRAIVSGYNASSPAQKVTCLEPSPDVFSAVAARAGLSASGLSDAVAAEGGLSETAASIGLRTQTITVLRDSNVQPCLARMNGSDQVQYDMMLRRSQSNIAGLLAIEQLTGAVRGANAVIGVTPGSGGDGKVAFTAFADEQKSRQESLNAQIKEATDKRTALEKDNTTCAGSSPPATLDCKDEAKTKRAADIEAIKSNLIVLNGRLEEAKQLETKYRATAATSISASQGSLTGASVSPGLAVTDTSVVAKAVQEITLNMINRDYTLQMCFDYARAGMLDMPTDAEKGVLYNTARMAAGAFCSRVMTSTATQHETQSKLSKAWSDKLPGILEAILDDGVIDAEEKALIREVVGAAQASPPAPDAAAASTNTTNTISAAPQFSGLDVRMAMLEGRRVRNLANLAALYDEEASN